MIPKFSQEYDPTSCQETIILEWLSKVGAVRIRIISGDDYGKFQHAEGPIPVFTDSGTWFPLETGVTEACKRHFERIVGFPFANEIHTTSLGGHRDL